MNTNARNTDPHTSHAAADENARSGRRTVQRQVTLNAARTWPGLTSAELARAADLDRYMLARRLPELYPQIAKGDARECRVTGRAGMTWWPTKGV